MDSAVILEIGTLKTSTWKINKKQKANKKTRENKATQQ